MSSSWPAVSYETWSATCDTLHAHAQVLGKLAVELALGVNVSELATRAERLAH
jgi:hypothetical protein